MKRKIGSKTLVKCTERAETWIPLLKLEADTLNEVFDQEKKWFKANVAAVDAGADVASAAMQLTQPMLDALEPRLSQPCSVPYADATDEMKGVNLSLLQSHIASGGFYSSGGSDNGFSQTGAMRFFIEPARCMATYVDFFKKVSLHNDATRPVVLRDTAGTLHSGGFGELYVPVNVVQYDATQQKSCVFALKNKSSVGLFSKPLLEVANTVTKTVQEHFALQLHRETTSVSLGETHLVLGFNPHAHFTYHQDAKEYTWSVTIQLSPGTSSIQIAGKDEVLFDGPGIAYLFPSQCFHRSGRKERRTLTATFFFRAKVSEGKATDNDADDKIMAKNDEGGPSDASQQV